MAGVMGWSETTRRASAMTWPTRCSRSLCTFCIKERVGNIVGMERDVVPAGLALYVVGSMLLRCTTSSWLQARAIPWSSRLVLSKGDKGPRWTGFYMGHDSCTCTVQTVLDSEGHGVGSGFLTCSSKRVRPSSSGSRTSERQRWLSRIYPYSAGYK